MKRLQTLWFDDVDMTAITPREKGAERRISPSDGVDRVLGQYGSLSYAIELTFGNNDWASLEQPLDKFLAAVVEGWKRALSHPSEMTQE